MASKQESPDTPNRIRIDAEELILALQSHDDGLEYFLDRSTGEIVFLTDDDILDLIEELRTAIDELPNGRAQDELARALKQVTRFEHSRTNCLIVPRCAEQWFEFEKDRMLALAKEWLGDEDLDAELKMSQASVTIYPTRIFSAPSL